MNVFSITMAIESHKLQNVLDSKKAFYDQISTTNILFKNDCYDFSEIWENDTIQLVGTSTSPENSQVFLIRIFQVNKKKDFLFIDSKNSEKFVNDVLDVFETMDYNYLIFEIKDVSSRVAERIMQILEHNEKKKILLVSIRYDLNKFFRNRRIKSSHISTSNTYKDLTDESQNALLWETNIQFQGVPVRMLDLFYRKDLYDLPASLFLETSISVGDEIPVHNSYVDRYYIPRKLVCQNKIKSEILDDSSEDRLCVLETEFDECKELGFSRIHLLKIDCEEFMESMNSKNSKDIISAYKNYIKEDDSCFSNIIWEKSSGDISNLKKYMVHESGDCNKLLENDMLKLNGNIFLVSSKAGMGKSSLLSSLALQTKKQYPHKWVIKLDFNDFIDELKHYKATQILERSLTAEVENFLMKILDCETEIENILAKKYMNKKKDIHVFLDGFDEISTYYEDVALKILEAFYLLKIDKIFISTRPEKLEMLQEKFTRPHYTVEPFSQNDQIEFLKKYCDIKEYSVEYESATKEILNLLSTSIQDTSKNLLSVPIITQMIAELFKADFRAGAQGYRKSSYERFSSKLDINDLYTRFTQTRYESKFFCVSIYDID